jgi:hypothetical protein
MMNDMASYLQSFSGDHATMWNNNIWSHICKVCGQASIPEISHDNKLRFYCAVCDELHDMVFMIDTATQGQKLTTLTLNIDDVHVQFKIPHDLSEVEFWVLYGVTRNTIRKAQRIQHQGD